MAFAAVSQQELPLSGKWLFRKANSSQRWLPATVPGSLHTDLLANGLIGNPYLGCNNMQLAWVDSADWEYRITFDLPNNIEKSAQIELVFEGLDTYADVYLNGVKVLVANNMFRKWRVPCSKYLKIRNNELWLVFRSVFKVDDSLISKLPYPLPGGDWAYIRKAAYHFGWDWGPRLVTCGIWRPVYLRVIPKVDVDNLTITTLEANWQKAIMAVDFDVVTESKDALRLMFCDAHSQKIYLDTQVKPQNGQVWARFGVDNPILWWPNGMGTQNLNRFRVLLHAGSRLVYETIYEVGISTVKLVAETNSIGQSFYF